MKGGSFDQSYLRPRQVNLSRLDSKLKRATPGMGWVSGCSGPLLAVFGYSYRYVIDLIIDSSSRKKKEIICERLFLKHSLCFPEPVS